MYTFIGCSGFHYDDWKGSFYPEDLSTDDWLPYYTNHFQTVEINNSFYSLPDEGQLKTWHKQTPAHFKFTMKGSRYITHMKKLMNDKDVQNGIKKFYNTISPLGGKIGCILWQLPGNLHRDDKKLDDFCSLLSRDFKNVIEFRHQSWFDDQVLQILKNHRVGYCIISAPDDLPELVEATTETGYVRFHGKDEWYKYDYSSKELEKWSKKINTLKTERVYCYFNNDFKANAIENAQMLKKKLTEN